MVNPQTATKMLNDRVTNIIMRMAIIVTSRDTWPHLLRNVVIEAGILSRGKVCIG